MKLIKRFGHMLYFFVAIFIVGCFSSSVYADEIDDAINNVSYEELLSLHEDDGSFADTIFREYNINNKTDPDKKIRKKILYNSVYNVFPEIKRAQLNNFLNNDIKEADALAEEMRTDYLQYYDGLAKADEGKANKYLNRIKYSYVEFFLLKTLQQYDNRLKLVKQEFATTFDRLQGEQKDLYLKKMAYIVDKIEQVNKKYLNLGFIRKQLLPYTFEQVNGSPIFNLNISGSAKEGLLKILNEMGVDSNANAVLTNWNNVIISDRLDVEVSRESLDSLKKEVDDLTYEKVPNIVLIASIRDMVSKTRTYSKFLIYGPSIIDNFESSALKEFFKSMLDDSKTESAKDFIKQNYPVEEDDLIFGHLQGNIVSLENFGNSKCIRAFAGQRSGVRDFFKDSQSKGGLIPVSASSLSMNDVEDFDNSFLSRFENIRGDLLKVSNEKSFYKVVKLQDLSGGTVGVIVVDEQQEIPDGIDKFENMPETISVKVSLLNQAKYYNITKWDNEDCAMTYNKFEKQRWEISKCEFCDYMVLLNNLFLNTADALFEGLRDIFLIIIALALVGRFLFRFIYLFDKEKFEFGDTKSFVKSYVGTFAKVAVFFILVFLPPRIYVQYTFYPIIWIGTGFSSVLTQSFSDYTAFGIEDDAAREMYGNNSVICTGESAIEDYYKRRRQKVENKLEDFKLYPSAEELLEKRQNTDFKIKNAKEKDIEIDDHDLYVGQFICLTQNIKSGFANMIILGNILLSSSVKDVTFSPMKFFTAPDFITEIAGDASGIEHSGIIDFKNGFKEFIMKLLVGFLFLGYAYIMIFFVLFYFLKVLVDICLIIVYLPFAYTLWVLDKGSLKGDWDKMVSFAKDLIATTLIFIMTLGFLTFTSTIIFGENIQSYIGMAMMTGNEAYVINNIDMQNISFFEIIFVLFLNLYFFTNASSYVSDAVSGVGSMSASYANNVKSGVKKVLGRFKPSISGGASKVRRYKAVKKWWKGS